MAILKRLLDFVKQLVRKVKDVAVREAAHVGAGAMAVFGLHYLVNSIFAAIVIEIAVVVGEVNDVTHKRDPLWKGIVDAVAWAAGLALGVVAAG